MRPLRRLRVASLVLAAASAHVVYPVAVAVVARRRPARSAPTPAAWPPLTVLIPAYHEADVIASKIADVHANGYPGSVEVLVVAEGDPETALRAEEAGARVLSPAGRLGKSQALNLGFAHATTPVVVVSDANNTLAPGSLASLAAWFDDPDVGAVAGEKVESDDGGEELYWRFESWLKQCEWRLGTTVGLVGELAAVRRDLWRPIPPDIATDDLWTACDVSEQGYRIAYEPRARAYDPPVDTLRAQWERRTRSVSGAMHIFVRRRRQLVTGGLPAAELWGHRLVRYTVVPLAHLGLVGLAVRRARTSGIARVFLAGHLAGVVALVRGPRTTTGPVGRVAAAAAQVVFLQGVAVGGLVRYLRGDRRVKWPTAKR